MCLYFNYNFRRIRLAFRIIICNLSLYNSRCTALYSIDRVCMQGQYRGSIKTTIGVLVRQDLECYSRQGRSPLENILTFSEESHDLYQGLVSAVRNAHSLVLRSYTSAAGSTPLQSTRIFFVELRKLSTLGSRRSNYMLRI